MHSLQPLLLLLFLVLATANPSPHLAPFQPAIHEVSLPDLDSRSPNPNLNGNPLALLRRQSNECPSGYNSCAQIGAVGFCCRDSTLCSPDQAGQIACCPEGAACTGTVGGFGQTPQTSTLSGSLGGFVLPTTTGGGFTFETGPVTVYGNPTGGAVRNELGLLETLLIGLMGFLI
ncbi:hypothetical protein M501DRAFT_1055172 [Patellaria atrata CBS 101060]|uniref:Hydrophobin n=1 Tax=Patellaria atrata CBS 101060 TaxID=1346257 RepID=A0A9P4VW90_9PEZI|nr:hypothetical protein M501DRAFT_1055172 [Patellaria atrata CBS 101060]